MVKVKAVALSLLVALGVGLAGPAAAQSTITLESFDLDTDRDSAPPTPAPRTQPPSAADCLTGDEGCDTALQSGRRFSLEDVVNLGIIDRREVAPPEGADEAEIAAAAARAAEPLPSIDLEVFFEYASDRLSADQMGPLFALAGDLRRIDFSGRQLVLMGHTDAVGSHAYNRDLSLRRAESVAAFLSSEAGIPRHRIRTAGMAFDYLKYPHDPRHAANRRVQIMMVKL